MTAAIYPKDTTFSKFARRINLPCLEDARGFFLFGGSAAESIKNLQPDSTVSGSVVGTPTYSTGYATVSHANGFKAGYIGGKPYTHLIVAKRGANNDGLIGHWTPDGNPVATADLLYVQTGTLTHSVDGTSRGGSINVSTLTGFALFASTYDGAVSRTYAHNGTSLLSGAGNYVSAAGQPVSELRVGASAYGAGNFDVAAAASFGRALTALEIGEIYTYLKTLLSARGVALT